MSRYCFGVDIGGTSVKMGLFHETGELIEKFQIPTDTSQKGSKILPQIQQALERKRQQRQIQQEEVLGIGVCAPGPVLENGMILNGVNLGWGTFQLKETLENLTGYSVWAANDANAAALGEYWQEEDRKWKSMVMVTLGTGVGGGVILNGKIYPGSQGSGGELGHMNVYFGSPRRTCNCGKKHCLELVSSAGGIVDTAREALKQYPQSILTRRNTFTAEDAAQAARQGDKAALAAFDLACRYLAIALANVSTVIDPEVFVLGGGVSKAGKLILNPTEQYFQQYSFPVGQKKVFQIAKLGNDAGIYGCAKMVLDSL